MIKIKQNAGTREQIQEIGRQKRITRRTSSSFDFVLLCFFLLMITSLMIPKESFLFTFAKISLYSFVSATRSFISQSYARINNALVAVVNQR